MTLLLHTAVKRGGTLPARRYRLRMPAEPIRVRDSVQIFELAKVLESGDAALVLWTLRGWVAYNQAENHRRNYREGRWWTYNSLSRWCETHFKWLSAKQLGTIMTRLERLGVILRKQFNASKLDNRYWYTVNEDVLTALVSAKQAAFEACAESGETSAQMGASSSQTGETCAKSGASSAQMGAYTTKESSRQESSIPDRTPQPPTPPAPRRTTVGVGGREPQRPEADSGEYTAAGEGPQPRQAHDSDPVDAAVPLSPGSAAPLSPLTPAARDLVAALMASYERLGLTEGYAARLISTHGEDHVRAVHRHVQANWHQYSVGLPSRIHSPVGFMTDELASRRLNLPPVPSGDVDPVGSDDLNQAPVLDDEWPDLPLPAPDPEAPGSHEMVGRRTAGEVWTTAHHQMSLLFDRPSFDMWLKAAQLRGYSGGTFIVGVPTAHAVDMLQHRYYRKVQRVVEGLANQPVSLTFEVMSVKGGGQ